MSEEIKTPDGIPLPHTTEFEDNGPGKNSTKIEVDMEKNAPFIKEVKARLDAANDPEVAKKIEEEFLATTGIPFEKAYEAMENKVTVIVDKADGSTEKKNQKRNLLKLNRKKILTVQLQRQLSAKRKKLQKKLMLNLLKMMKNLKLIVWLMQVMLKKLTMKMNLMLKLSLKLKLVSLKLKKILNL